MPKDRKYCNKSDLVNQLAKEKSFTRAKSFLIIDSIFQAIATALKKGRRVEIRGLGSFEVRHYKSYTGHNPKTGKKIKVKAKKLPFFKSGKLKEEINKTKSLKN